MRSIVARLTLMAAVPLVFSACARASTSPTTAPSPAATATSSTTASSAPPSISAAPSTSAAPKADGQIVFEDAGQDFMLSQIWIENADGSNVRKIVSDKFTDNGVSLSPDGRTVVFYQGYTDSLEAALADPRLMGAIMTVNVDGTRLHEIDTGNRAKGCDAGPEGTNPWSPDGRRLAFTQTCFEKDGTFVGQGLWTINLDGTGRHQVTHNAPGRPCPPPYSDCVHLEDHRAVWSPDGLLLAFERIDTSTTPERAAIFTVGIDGKGLRQVTPWKLDANDPVWSPDGTLIAFQASAEPSPTQNIYMIHPDGSGLRKLTANDEEGQATFHPSWSPDGTQILFSHSPSTDGWADFFVMNRDGSDLHILAATAMHENAAYWGNTPQP
jgi:hypothetical protein